MKAILASFLLLVAIASQADVREEIDNFFCGAGVDVKYERFFYTLRNAVLNNRRDELAAMNNYPLKVITRHGLLEIGDQQTFLQHYDAIISSDIIETIRNQSFDDLEASAEGVMIGQRQVLMATVTMQEDSCETDVVKVISYTTGSPVTGETGLH